MKLKQLFIILILISINTTKINAKDLLPDAYTSSHSDTSGIKKIKKVKWYIQAGILDANAKEYYSYILIEPDPPPVHTGISSRYDVPFKSFIGFKAGLFFDIPINKKISFTPGLNFIKKGASTYYSRGGNDAAVFTTNYQMNFIEFPLNFTYNIHENKGVVFGLGVVISYGIGGKFKQVDTFYDSTGVNISFSDTNNNSIKFDNNSTSNSDGNIHFKSWEISGNIFFGYKFSSHYIIKAEYNKGFTNLFVDGGGEVNGSFKTSYFALNFCYGL